MKPGRTSRQSQRDYAALFCLLTPLIARLTFNDQRKKMSAPSRSTKIQISGFAGGISSFVVLFVGLLATGGGHGAYTLWYVGLVAAGLSVLLLVAGTAGAAWKKEKKGLMYGLLAIAVFVVVGIYFFDLTEWLAEILF